MPRTYTPDKLEERFDLRLDEEVRERLDWLAKNTGQSRSQIIRTLIMQATVEDIRNAE